MTREAEYTPQLAKALATTFFGIHCRSNEIAQQRHIRRGEKPVFLEGRSPSLFLKKKKSFFLEGRIPSFWIHGGLHPIAKFRWWLVHPPQGGTFRRMSVPDEGAVESWISWRTKMCADDCGVSPIYL